MGEEIFHDTCTIISICGSDTSVTPNNAIFGEIGQRHGQIDPCIIRSVKNNKRGEMQMRETSDSHNGLSQS